MNSPQQEDDKMMDLVVLVYQENKSDFETIPALADTLEQVIIIKKDITVAVEQQSTNTTGTTESKAEFKLELATQTYQMAAGLSAWATDATNAIVLAQTNITVSGINRLADKKIGPSCTIILKLAKDNLAVLAPYGITAETVQQLEKTIDDFATLSTQPRKKTFDKKGYTQKLATLFKTAKSLLTNKADKLIFGIQKTFPDTFNKYQAARISPRSGGGSTDKPLPPTTPPAPM